MLDPKKIILTQIFEGGGGGSSVEVEPLSITANGTYTAETGKAYSPVTANVPNSYAAGDEGKVVSNGALVSQTSDTATQNGTVDTTLINSLLVNVSGGGGTSNIVTGTFTGTAQGALDVNIPYSGSGFPVLTIIYVKYPETGSFAALIPGPYYIAEAVVNKVNSSEPNYTTTSGNANRARMTIRYKNDTSYATVYTTMLKDRNAGIYVYSGTSADNSCPVRIHTKTTMSVYIGVTNNSNLGFAPNIEYEYIVVYSS